VDLTQFDMEVVGFFFQHELLVLIQLPDFAPPSPIAKELLLEPPAATLTAAASSPASASSASGAVVDAADDAVPAAKRPRVEGEDAEAKEGENAEAASKAALAAKKKRDRGGKKHRKEGNYIRIRPEPRPLNPYGTGGGNGRGVKQTGLRDDFNDKHGKKGKKGKEGLPDEESHMRSSLRPSTAQLLLTLAKVRPGDVVLDAMCGTGTVPIIAAAGPALGHGPVCYALGGELNTQAVEFARQNAVALGGNLDRVRSFHNACSSGGGSAGGSAGGSDGGSDGGGEGKDAGKVTSAGGAEEKVGPLGQVGGQRPCGLDLLQWDASCLPLRDGVVDAVVIDMPFGHLCGSKKSNGKLYPTALAEMRRVLRVGGRAVLLIMQKKVLHRALEQIKYVGGEFMSTKKRRQATIAGRKNRWAALKAGGAGSGAGGAGGAGGTGGAEGAGGAGGASPMEVGGGGALSGKGKAPPVLVLHAHTFHVVEEISVGVGGLQNVTLIVLEKIEQQS
jgi:SAM-dependent methyltransferase